MQIERQLNRKNKQERLNMLKARNSGLHGLSILYQTELKTKNSRTSSCRQHKIFLIIKITIRSCWYCFNARN
uniref:Uncharacterized protein n=1 Tax=Rhizophora mucronata TaxID=61149 RepID=A0A2P2NZ19_RHIMU